MTSAEEILASIELVHTERGVDPDFSKRAVGILANSSMSLLLEIDVLANTYDTHEATRAITSLARTIGEALHGSEGHRLGREI